MYRSKRHHRRPPRVKSFCPVGPILGRWQQPWRGHEWRQNCRRPRWQKSSGQRSLCQRQRSRPPFSSPIHRSPATTTFRSRRWRNPGRPLLVPCPLVNTCQPACSLTYLRPDVGLFRHLLMFGDAVQRCANFSDGVQFTTFAHKMHALPVRCRTHYLAD